MVLGNVKETITNVDFNQDKEIITRIEKNYEMLFIRGDGVILVSPSHV